MNRQVSLSPDTSAITSPLLLSPMGLIKQAPVRVPRLTQTGLQPDQRVFTAELKEGGKKTATSAFFRVAHCVGELLPKGNVDDGGSWKTGRRSETRHISYSCEHAAGFLLPS